MGKPLKERTKVVVRKLPPGLNEQGFKAVVEKLIEGKYTWLSYCEGKASVRKVLFSRAYIDFSDPAFVYEFKAKFDGHTFVSSKGNQYKCSVEYAPFQKVPAPPKKRNPLEGTIEQDADYQAFVKVLDEGPELLPSAAIQREQQEKAAAKDAPSTTGTKTVRVTPLMEYLRNKYLNNPSLRPGRRGKQQKEAHKEPERDAKGRGGRGKESTKELKDAKGSARGARTADSSKTDKAGPSRPATAQDDARGKGKQKPQEQAAAQAAPKALLARPKQGATKESAAAPATGKGVKEPKGKAGKESKAAGHEQAPAAGKGKGGKQLQSDAAPAGDASTSRPSTAQQHGGKQSEKHSDKRSGDKQQVSGSGKQAADKNLAEKGGAAKVGEVKGKAQADGKGKGSRGGDSVAVEAVTSGLASLSLPASSKAKGGAAGGAKGAAGAGGSASTSHTEPKVLARREPQADKPKGDAAAAAAVGDGGSNAGAGNAGAVDAKGRKVRKGFQAYVPRSKRAGGAGDGDAG